MSASKTSSTTSYSRAGSPSIDDLLADLEASVAAPPAYHDDTVYHPQTPRVLPASSELNIDPEVPLWANQFTEPMTGPAVPFGVIPRSLPPVRFTTLAEAMGHPQGFDFSAKFGEASRSPCIQWDADFVFKSHRPSGAVEERFVVNSGAAFGVDGYEDICCLAQKRKADEDVEMSDVDTEPVVEETRKKRKVDQSPSRRSHRKATASPSPAKRADPKRASRKFTPKPASRESTPIPAPKPTPRAQTSQKSAAAGPSVSIPVRQTRWTTQAEKMIMEA
ncbi:hypothetical protein BDZ89DRAFT_1160523 [Hymenopellis radicata]|nr:hypothetical protein BDZ89DRAFT_1160523 [Hymenopellis radicata]